MTDEQVASEINVYDVVHFAFNAIWTLKYCALWFVSSLFLH